MNFGPHFNKTFDGRGRLACCADKREGSWFVLSVPIATHALQQIDRYSINSFCARQLAHGKTALGSDDLVDPRCCDDRRVDAREWCAAKGRASLDNG